MYDVVSHLVFAVGRECVTDMWVAGKPVMRGRKILTLDEEQVLKVRVGRGRARIVMSARPHLTPRLRTVQSASTWSHRIQQERHALNRRTELTPTPATSGHGEASPFEA